MMRLLILMISCMIVGVVCATEQTKPAPVALGDSEATMVAKLMGQGARDVTKETKCVFYHQISGQQRYYWWEFPDKTIVAILVAGPTKEKMTVVVIETGEPGKGVEGISYWRSQNLKREASFKGKGAQNNFEQRSSAGSS